MFLRAFLKALISKDSCIVMATEQQLEFLKNCQYKEIPFFDLKGWEGPAKVVKVYDGDTVTVVLYVGENPYKFRVRLEGIDTAEIKSKNPMEKKVALETKTVTTDFIGDDGIIWLTCNGKGKFGRILGKIFQSKDSNLCLNDFLITKGLAYSYNGGKRIPFDEWYTLNAENDS